MSEKMCKSCSHQIVCLHASRDIKGCAYYEKYEEERPQWIPCSERLPERGGYYLITNIDELVRLDYFRTSTNDFDNYSSIAWMPLPEPYKEEGEEK